MTSIIKFNLVSKTYKKNVLFDQVSLDIKKGSIVGFVGPNGCGKSVLFKMICGFVQPDKGTISIDESFLDKHNQFPKNTGIIIDRPGFIESKSGIENLRRLAAIHNHIVDQDIRDTMELVGLSPDNKEKVKHYSLGMKQKLCIAQAIMEDQELLILDEPFNALDKDSVANIRELLLSFKDQGKTILLTSHNPQDIDILCDTVFEITNHQLIEA